MYSATRKFSAFGIATLIFLSVFTINGISQTTEELQYYAERIEFGEIDVKRSALFDLRNFETESAARIAIPALRDVSEIVRATATHTVVFLPEAEAISVLSPLLNEKAAFVRRETAYALGEVGGLGAASLLMKLLQTDKELEVKTASAVSLGKIADVSAIRQLNSILSIKPKSKRAFLRRAAARSIGQIARQIQNQTKIQTTPESFLPDKYKKVVRPKYRSLTKAFPLFSQSNTMLLSVMRNRKETNDTRREASFAIGEIGDQSSIEILKQNLRSRDYYLVEISKEALKKIYSGLNFSNSDSLSYSTSRK